MGLRERKKQRTRAALVEAALQLFDSQGYDRTTVAQIAAAADVSTRTFFLHFATKEAVVLANTDARVDLAVRAIAERAPDAPMPDVLADAVDRMLTDTRDNDLDSGLARTRVRLAMTVPGLRTRVLERLHVAESQIVDALREAYPDGPDEVTLAAAVGGMFGAVVGAASRSLRRGDPPAEVLAAMRRARDLSAAALTR